MTRSRANDALSPPCRPGLRRETPRRAPGCRDSALQSQDQRHPWLCSAGRSRLVFGGLRTRFRTCRLVCAQEAR
jgi:hypothetical protein